MPFKIISSADAQEYPALAKFVGQNMSAKEYNKIIHGGEATENSVEEAPKKTKK